MICLHVVCSATNASTQKNIGDEEEKVNDGDEVTEDTMDNKGDSNDSNISVENNIIEFTEDALTQLISNQKMFKIDIQR